ncbi:hypothetical protein [Lysobacter sp. GCM10012299]|uniref:hypothetical protein n=1 Tax=Lysobacter sp. GCM10012299 TaxID=3317333 RepID=UPI003607D4C7
MKGLNRTRLTLLASPLLVLVGMASATESPLAPQWLVGTWTKTVDEDQGPPDSITFRSDGTFATYDDRCRAHTNTYFVKNGLVFLLIPLEKGPIALVLDAGDDHATMRFTSPRTRNNAVYVPSEGPHCRLQES